MNPNDKLKAFDAKWLRSVPGLVISELCSSADFITIPHGQIIYGLGTDQNWLWGLQRGCARVHVCMNEMEPILGHLHHPGAWFGETEVLQNISSPVEMRAAGEVSVVRIHYVKFRSLANQNPALWEALAILASMNQTLGMSAANDLVMRTSSKRLAAVLLRLSGDRANYQETTISTTIRANQDEIANLANLSISKTSEELAGFKKAKAVHHKYGKVEIIDSHKLQAILEN